MNINYKENTPRVSNDAFCAPNSSIIGKCLIEKNVGIWFGAVLRADNEVIHIQEGSNIQDNCTVHVDDGYPVVVGKNVTVGHNVVLHGCKVGDNSIIGMGSIILDGAEIGDNVIIGAGSLVTSGKKIPAGVLCLGSPAKVIRDLTDEEIKSIEKSAKHYVEKSKEFTK